MRLLTKIKKLFIDSHQTKVDPFWIQKLEVFRTPQRLDLFKRFCDGRKVLHIGCTDHPIFDPKHNLHLQLSKFCSELHGLDVDKEGLSVLKRHFDAPYFSDFSQIENEVYDVVLVPETIEHVDNVEIFLKQINEIKADTFIISGPNCFHQFFKNGYEKNSNVWIEGIHPDHNCWYSPYTLKNSIEKYTKFGVNEVHLCNNDIMVVCICKKRG